MAYARSETVEKTITAVQTVEVVTLELTPEEAKTLLVITEFVSGRPGESRRMHTDRIGTALRDAGVTRFARNGGEINSQVRKEVAGISFLDIAGLKD